MKTYSISELAINESSYNLAIQNVKLALNAILDLNLSLVRDCYQVDMLAEALNIRFDKDGRIVTSELIA